MSSRPNGLDAHGPGSAVTAELGTLFHRLNNQLGVVLACAEVLEAKATDEAACARAAEVVTHTLHALGTVREIRQHVSAASPQSFDSEQERAKRPLVGPLQYTTPKL